MPTLTLPSGATLAYGEAGSGTALVLVHGSPGEGRAWARVLKHLPSTLRVLTPDLPGYGGSTGLPAGSAARTAAMAEAVGALIESCGEPVLLAGHSYGGNVAIHAAARAPGRVRGLAAVEPVFFRALELAGDTATLEAGRRFFEAYAARVDAGEPDAVGLMIDYWFGAGAYGALPAPVVGFLRGAAARNAQDVRGALSETLDAEALARIDCPTVVAFGAASTDAARAIAAALAGQIRGARLEPIEGAMHGMLDTHPQAVAALIVSLAA
jgi:pimeloyl-ACP methyl ester carboxylesterase